MPSPETPAAKLREARRDTSTSVQNRVSTFLYDLEQESRTQPNYRGFLEDQVRYLTEEELKALKGEVDADRVPDLFRNPTNTERVLLLGLTHARLDELKKGFIRPEHPLLTVPSAVPIVGGLSAVPQGLSKPNSADIRDLAEWANKEKWALAKLGIAAAVVVAPVIWVGRKIRNWWRGSRDKAKEAADAARSSSGGGHLWHIFVPIIFNAIGYAGLGAGLYFLWKKIKGMDLKLDRMDALRLQAVKQALQKIEADLRGMNFRTAGKRAKMRAYEGIFATAMVGLTREEEEAFATAEGLLPGPKAITGADGRTVFELRYVGGAKKLEIKEIPPPLDSAKQSAAGAFHFFQFEARDPEVNIGNADLVHLENLFSDPDVLSLKVHDLRLMGDKATFAEAQALPPLSLPKYAGNERVQRALYFLGKMLDGKAVVGRLPLQGYLHGMTDAAGTHLDDAAIDNLTVAEVLQNSGLLFRTVARAEHAFRTRRYDRPADLQAGLAETFRPELLDAEATNPLARQAIRALDPTLAGDEEEFLLYCRRSTSMISAVHAGSAPDDATLDPALLTKCQTAAKKLAQSLCDGTSDECKILKKYLDGIGVPDAFTKFDTAMRTRATLCDGIQMYLFLHQARRNGNLEDNFADANRMGGALLRYKIAELVGRDDATKSLEIFKKLRSDREATRS